MMAPLTRRLGVILVALAIAASWATPAQAAFTFNNAVTNTGSGSLGTIAATGTGVLSGDLVVIFVTWEGATTTVSATDGTTSFTPDAFGVLDNPGSSGEPHSAFLYLLSSVATGAPTYTVTFGASRAFRNVIVTYFTPSGGSVSRVAANGTAGSTGAPLTDVNSGSITVTGTDGLAFGAYGEYGSTMTAASLKINGVAADRYQQIATNTSVWTKTYGAGFTGNALGTLNTANRYNLQILAFEIGAAPPPSARKLLLIGVGNNE